MRALLHLSRLAACRARNGGCNTDAVILQPERRSCSHPPASFFGCWLRRVVLHPEIVLVLAPLFACSSHPLSSAVCCRPGVCYRPVRRRHPLGSVLDWRHWRHRLHILQQVLSDQGKQNGWRAAVAASLHPGILLCLARATLCLLGGATRCPMALPTLAHCCRPASTTLSTSARCTAAAAPGA